MVIPDTVKTGGLTLQNLNRPAEAEKAFQDVLSVEPDSEALLYALAVLYIQQQQDEKARPVVSRLLELNPQQPEYRNLLRSVRLALLVSMEWLSLPKLLLSEWNLEGN